jgi:Tol biopolymer transport system component
MKIHRCRTVALAVIITSSAVGQPSPVAAGSQRIFFNRIRVHSVGLYIASADGSGERELLPLGTVDYNPSWSRDGRWIAFTSERNGSADLYRVKPDGTGLERLTADPAYDDQAGFSPDSSQIVFVSTRAAGRANLWVLNVVTGKAPTHLRREWRFSPRLVA